MSDEQVDLAQEGPQKQEEQKQETSVAQQAASQAIDPVNLGEVAFKVISSVLDNFDI